MNFTQKGRLAAGCNWAMAGTAVVFTGYVFVQLFSVPPQSAAARTSIPVPAAAVLPPAPAPAPATAASTPAGPTGGIAPRPAGTASVVPPAGAVQPAPTAGTQGSPVAPAAASRTAGVPQTGKDLEAVWGTRVYQAPAVPIPALNPHTLPPGVGKDF
jgi:hypothetical protein